ncbi:MAG: SDR family NAD(P)-dependent oxidoreductase, partial [Cyanobacteria bacterium P01_D01_bin.2]
IEQSPVNQGFEAHSYDLIIAANVLHATTDLDQTLAHVRSLLAPGGQLVLLEGTQPLLWLDLIFGMTAGWWKRPGHPLLSASEWQSQLQSSGFIEVVPLLPKSGESLAQSVILATAPPAATEVIVLAPPQIKLAPPLATELGARLVYLDTATGDKQGINPFDSHRFTSLLSNTETLQKIVYLVDEPESGQSLEDFTQQSLSGLLHLVQALDKNVQLANIQLIIVTQGASDGTSSPAQASAWGLGRVIELEYPHLNCCRVDLDPTVTARQQVATLCQELAAAAKTGAVLYRQGRRHIARLAKTKTSDLKIPSQPFKLGLSRKGSPENLHLVPCARRQPACGEVEIQVLAAGLNFIDVLDALALLPFERDWLGVECAGKIVAVGKGVEEFHIGDAVIALAPGSFQQYVTVTATLVGHQPRSLSPTEAATIPANFLTADYALRQIAKLQPGERVLIHAAAGGTGMAAIKIAQQIGAEIYATASPGKWEALQTQGVTHIMNSRTLDFAEEIMARTKGQGVNVVLNSLSGEFIPKGLSVLAPRGRFLEIGKRDIWPAQQVAHTRPDIAYHVIDLMSVGCHQPEQIQPMLQRLQHQFESRELAIVPHQVFPVAKAPQAFRHMQQAQHVGKIVLDFTQVPPTIQSEATYLITGGLGGLGLETASWLVEQGARHLALIGRSASSIEAVPQLKQLQQQGIKILLLQADVAVRSQLEKALQQIETNLPPLRGVIHAAGVLDDGILQRLTWGQMAPVLAPKVWGAWNLHELTQHCRLDLFVLYSSA